MNKEKNFISVVIYVHNAEKRIAQFIGTIREILERNFENAEIICVNDYSDDLSIREIRQVCKETNSVNVTVLNMSYFHGLEIAMNAGVDLAIGDFVYEFDSSFMDFSSELIMQIYQRALKGYDIVSAIPDAKQKVSANLFYFLFDKFTDTSYKMRTERFRILSRRVINRIGSMNKTVPYRKAIYSNCGLKTDSIKYVPNSIQVSYDKKEQRYRKSLAIDSLILFTNVGYKFSIGMTFIMMFMTIFMLLYSVFTYLFATPVEGWTTTIFFLSVAFLGLFGILTIIIKYLQLLLKLVFERKRYSFESIEKLS